MFSHHFLKLPASIVLTLVLHLDLALPLRAAPKGSSNQTQSAPAAEAEYTQKIEQRAADILAALQLNDPAKSAKVHDLLIAQYRALKDWHDANDAKLKGASAEQARQTGASLKALHQKFTASLSAELNAGLVERVKDKMTYGKVPVTYDAYCDIVPNLTAPQKQRILELLKEAREEAMDAGNADEKSAIFKLYKGRINNYLSSEGHDVKQAYKDWGEKQKVKKPQPAPQPGK